MKITRLLLIVPILLSSLVACNKNTPPAPTSTTTVQTTTQNTPPDPILPSGDLLYGKFQNPAKDLSAKPLFFWNIPLSEMTEEQMREIVRRSYEESGYSGFGILPYWMDGYLSDRYFELYEAALE